MLSKQTIVNVCDNSGAKKAMIIGIPGATRKRNAYVGDVVICAIKKADFGMTVKKHQVVRGLVVRTKFGVHRKNGQKISFNENAIVLIKKDGTLIGTRIFGPITREIKDKKYDKLVSLVTEIL